VRVVLAHHAMGVHLLCCGSNSSSLGWAKRAVSKMWMLIAFLLLSGLYAAGKLFGKSVVVGLFVFLVGVFLAFVCVVLYAFFTWPS
jgi:hypothetical protein